MMSITTALRMIVLFLFGGTYTPDAGDPVVFSGILSSVYDVVVAQPLILLFVLIPLVGIGVGMFKRLINVN